jgi:hypothetical protein
MHSSSPSFVLPAHFILVDLISLVILGEVYKSWSSRAVFSSLLSLHLSSVQGIYPGPRLLVVIRNKLIFYGELSHPQPSSLRTTPSRLSETATLHTWRAYPPSATWVRAMPWWQDTHLTWGSRATYKIYIYNIIIHNPNIPAILSVSLLHNNSGSDTIPLQWRVKKEAVVLLWKTTK